MASAHRLSVGIVGLGYVGMPVAQAATRAGFQVIGFDVSSNVVLRLNQGVSHVDDISHVALREMLESGFRATHDPDSLDGCDVFVICVPTPLNESGGPDLSAIVEAGRTLSPRLKRGCLVVLESTSHPGTTETVLRPLLELNGLIAGTDFQLAFSPERIDPGNQRYDLSTTPKIVGGFTDACASAAASFYGSFVHEVVTARGLREAELAKLLENTYRQINIALVNEMAIFCHELDIDLWDAIRCASSKPFGFEPFFPGPGVGGHCIPIDPRYLDYYVRNRTGSAFRFVELAQDINARMPHYVGQRVSALLNQAGLATLGASVLLLGITYKPNISDVRESPALPLARTLRDMGVRVSFHDPYVSAWSVDGQPVMYEASPYEAAAEADCVVLLQNHREYDIDTIEAVSSVMLDTRGVTTGLRAKRL